MSAISITASTEAKHREYGTADRLRRS